VNLYSSVLQHYRPSISSNDVASLDWKETSSARHGVQLRQSVGKYGERLPGGADEPSGMQF